VVRAERNPGDCGFFQGVEADAAVAGKRVPMVEVLFEDFHRDHVGERERVALNGSQSRCAAMEMLAP
jgi:hypothetical protein